MDPGKNHSMDPVLEKDKNVNMEMSRVRSVGKRKKNIVAVNIGNFDRPAYTIPADGRRNKKRKKIIFLNCSRERRKKGIKKN